MKKIFALLMATALLFGLTACTDKSTGEPDTTTTQKAPTEPDNLKFTALVNQLQEDGTPYSLITADAVGFSWLNIDQNNPPILDFAPEFGQTVEVELVSGTLKMDGDNNPGAVTAAVKSMKPAVPLVPAQYVRANGPYDEPKQKTVVIESKRQLDDYYRANRNPERENWKPGKYDFDYAYDDSKSFAEAMEKYDDAFFEDHLLVLAVLVESSGTIRHMVTGVQGNVITIRKFLSYPATEDMANWHIMVEISRADWDGKAFELALEGYGNELPTSTQAPPKKSTAPANAQSQPIESTMPTGKTLSEGQTRPDLALIREDKKDDLLLQVDADYAYKFTEEPFTLTATITNTTGHDITYGAGSGMRNVHQEIQVRIRGKNGAEFTDMDIYGKIMTADMKLDTLKAGETFTETIRFLPGTPRSDSEINLRDIDWFPAGEYEGTAVFTYFAGTMENPGEQKQLQLEFPVILFN